MFPVFHLYALYRSVCLFYLRACTLHSTTYGLQDRIPPPPTPSPPFKDGYFSLLLHWNRTEPQISSGYWVSGPLTTGMKSLEIKTNHLLPSDFQV